MLARNQNRTAAEEQVLKVVKASKGPYPPAELIKELKQTGFVENTIRAAMWDLIDRRQVRVTGDLKLTRPE